MYNNTTGSNNTAIGAQALLNNTTASNNVAVGYQALYSNTVAINMTALGYQAGYSFSGDTGYCTLVGYRAGYSAVGTGTTSYYNTFVGARAGEAVNGSTIYSGSSNTFVGYLSGSVITTGRANVILGRYDGNQDGLDIRTSTNYVVLSDGDGNRQASMAEGKSLALDSAVPQTGTGITFPATQSASSNANTLDDYEEGTWTPTTVLNGFTQSISTITGSYTKTGNVVVVCMKVELSASGYPSSYSEFSGLPFTVKAGFDGAGCFNGSNVGSGNQIGNALAGNGSTNVFWSSITVGTTPSTNWYATITYLV